MSLVIKVKDLVIKVKEDQPLTGLTSLVSKKEYGTDEIKPPEYKIINEEEAIVKFQIPEGETIIGRKAPEGRYIIDELSERYEIGAIYKDKFYRLGISDICTNIYQPSEGKYGEFKLIRIGNDVYIQAMPNATKPIKVDDVVLLPGLRERLRDGSKIEFGCLEAYYEE